MTKNMSASIPNDINVSNSNKRMEVIPRASIPVPELSRKQVNSLGSGDPMGSSSVAFPNWKKSNKKSVMLLKNPNVLPTF